MNDQKPSMSVTKKLRQESIRQWLTDNRGRRRVLPPEQALIIAERIGRLLDELPPTKECMRSRIAAEAFNLDEHSANSKLRHYATPRGWSGQGRGSHPRKASRAPDLYQRLLAVIAKRMSCDIADLLVRVFESTVADSFQGDHSWFVEAARTFEHMLDELAGRVSRRLRLGEYCRTVATYGVIRDLKAKDIAFHRDYGDDLSSPQMDLVEALLPITDGMKSDPHYGIGLPYVFQGRLPTVLLYRIRVSHPVPVDLKLKSSQPGSELCAIESRRGSSLCFWEVRLGVGPRNNSLQNSMFFELASVSLIKVHGPCGSQINGPELRPALAYELAGAAWPSEELQFYRGETVLWGEVRDASTGEDHTDVEQDAGSPFDLDWPFCIDEINYISATPESCWRYLAEWPARYEERIEYHELDPLTHARPIGGYFPPGTPGQELERQLLKCAQSGGTIEEKLYESGEALRRALIAVRKERQDLAKEEKRKEQSTPYTEFANEYLALDPRVWRERLGMTQKEAARMLQVDARSLSDYERHTRSLPHITRLAMLFCQLHPEIAQSLAQRLEESGSSDQARDPLQNPRELSVTPDRST